MNPPSMEVIFLLLSGVILIAGVLYWFWSHLQLTQKKVQLLENAVFELRTMLLSSERGPPVAPHSPEVPVAAAIGGGSGSGYEDLGDDDWNADDGLVSDSPDSAVPIVAPTTIIREIVEDVVESDLMPGGRILPPTVTEVNEVSRSASTGQDAIVDAPAEDFQFRELFVAKAGAVEESTRTAESLESMPVKELRRLAQDRGIAGAADMRKKEILAALRQQISTVQTTLDLTKMGAVSEESATEGHVDESVVSGEGMDDGVEAVDVDDFGSENPRA